MQLYMWQMHVTYHMSSESYDWVFLSTLICTIVHNIIRQCTVLYTSVNSWNIHYNYKWNNPEEINFGILCVVYFKARFYLVSL